MRIIPSRNQWKKWTLPSKAGYIAMWIGVISFISTILSQTPSLKKVQTKGHQSPAVIAGNNVTITYNYKKEDSAPQISLGIALYIYEKGFILYEQTMTYYTEMRNFVSNCSIYKQQLNNLPRKRTIIPEPGAWFLVKLRLENLSSVPLTNIRLGIYGMPLKFDNIVTTPNIKASLNYESTTNNGLGTYVVNIKSLAPNDTAIITIQSKINNQIYSEFIQKKCHSIVFPFIVSDQFKGTGINVKIIKFNASEMLKQEAELFTGERTIVNEKIEYRILDPKEPDIDERFIIKYEPLPAATKCPTGTAGNW